ncbi:hypothetical protein [Candidatus Leptofilum sp.]|uniref:DUF7793 family protein n=1 Tax=Candidatus Leptofilum sp. TaxID=3241576 RepID=UPI003B5A93CF
MSEEKKTDQAAKQTKDAAYGRISLHENGIIYVAMKDFTPLNLENAKQLVADVQSIDSSGQALLLIESGQDIEATFEAQRYLGTVGGLSHLALVVHNKMQSQIATFFLSMMRAFRSPYEMKVFYQTEHAEIWLLNTKRPSTSGA